MAATSLAVRSAGSLAQQTAQTESLAAASIDCTGPPPLISGGMLFMDFSNNFTGGEPCTEAGDERLGRDGHSPVLSSWYYQSAKGSPASDSVRLQLLVFNVSAGQAGSHAQRDLPFGCARCILARALRHITSSTSTLACWHAGVNFVVDDSLPGAVLKLVGQDVHIRDSTFDNLASGADGTLIALNSSVIITNTTFASNIQAAAGALFLNGSRATVFDCLFDRNKGGLQRLPETHCHLPLLLHACISGRTCLASLDWAIVEAADLPVKGCGKPLAKCLQLERDDARHSCRCVMSGKKVLQISTLQGISEGQDRRGRMVSADVLWCDPEIQNPNPSCALPGQASRQGASKLWAAAACWST